MGQWESAMKLYDKYKRKCITIVLTNDLCLCCWGIPDCYCIYLIQTYEIDWNSHLDTIKEIVPYKCFNNPTSEILGTEWKDLYACTFLADRINLRCLVCLASFNLLTKHPFQKKLDWWQFILKKILKMYVVPSKLLFLWNHGLGQKHPWFYF